MGYAYTNATENVGLDGYWISVTHGGGTEPISHGYYTEFQNVPKH